MATAEKAAKKEAKGTKREKLFRSKIEEGKTYPLDQAVQILKECATAKFKESVDISVNLGIDAKKSDQNVRGSTVLPHGNGKSVKVAVFAQGAKADEAKAAGADIVGMQDLADKMKGGDLSYQVVIAEPAAMRVVGALGQVLGPRGLMPNPKTGTVTPDVAKAVTDIKGGKISFRVDKQSNLHLVIGKASFSPEQLVENYAAALDEVLRAKPSSSKGRYVKKVFFTTTMGPGIPVDPNRTRNLLEDAAPAL